MAYVHINRIRIHAQMELMTFNKDEHNVGIWFPTDIVACSIIFGLYIHTLFDAEWIVRIAWILIHVEKFNATVVVDDNRKFRLFEITVADIRNFDWD